MYSVAFICCTERKPKNTNWAGLGMRQTTLYFLYYLHAVYLALFPGFHHSSLPVCYTECKPKNKTPVCYTECKPKNKTPVCYTECKLKNTNGEHLRTRLQFTMHGIIVYNFTFRHQRLYNLISCLDQRPKVHFTGLLLSQSHCIPCSYYNMV